MKDNTLSGSAAFHILSFVLLFIVLSLPGCGGGSSSSPPTPTCTGGTPSNLAPPSQINQMAVYQSTCQGSVNSPVVTLTVCVPHTTTCQSIPNILVDIGSTGLRLSHTLSITSQLPQEQISGQNIFECFSFVSGYNFGPVVTAEVTMGNESPITVPVQISNSTLPAPQTCQTTGPSSPFQPYYNGILGLLFPQYDGGAYYAGSNYSPVNGTGILNSNQLPYEVQNPVFLLPNDYEGILLSGFPLVPPQKGASNVSGLLTFGVSSATGLTQLKTNSSGTITANYNNSSSLPAFFDTGSNGLFIDNSHITPCTGSLAGFFCGNLSSQSATLTGTNGQSSTFSFSIVSAQTLFFTGNNDFSSLGGPQPGEFDAGFPAFLNGQEQEIGLEWTSNTNTSGIGYFLAPTSF